MLTVFDLNTRTMLYTPDFWELTAGYSADEFAILTGSMNLTRAAMTQNHEHSTLCRGRFDSPAGKPRTPAGLPPTTAPCSSTTRGRSLPRSPTQKSPPAIPPPSSISCSPTGTTRCAMNPTKP